MLTSGDIVDLELGSPGGREAGFARPAIIVSAQRILDHSPSVIQIVPLTTTVRGFDAEIEISPEPLNALTERSAAQCQHIRAVSPARVEGSRGNVGPVVLAQIRVVLSEILDIP